MAGSVNSIGDEVKKLYGKELQETPKRKRTGKRSAASVCVVAGIIVYAAIHVLAIGYYYNRFASMTQYIKAQQSQIEKEYQRRVDLIPNLVDIAGKYAEHERELFRYVSDARSLLETTRKLNEGLSALKKTQIERTLSGLIALAEQYPDLKATKSFQDLMDMVEVTENRLASMREKYISLVREYNTALVVFPSNLFNYFLGFKEIDYLHAEDISVPKVGKSNALVQETEGEEDSKEGIHKR